MNGKREMVSRAVLHGSAVSEIRFIPANRVVTLGYDGSTRMTVATMPDGAPWTYAYDSGLVGKVAANTSQTWKRQASGRCMAGECGAVSGKLCLCGRISFTTYHHRDCWNSSKSPDAK
jgi:YD repeat-containing protein